jgi:thiamine transport system ATP-binding protein
MLEIQDLVVRYGDVEAVAGLTLDVAADETLALLGPSGCGKSTLLRAIAGLEPVESGSVTLDGADLARLAPHERGVGMMFQQHALFPHRNVAANIEFGLRMAGMDVTGRRHRVAELLELVGLAGYESRETTTLSGGEAQRVALARSLAPSPRVLLLDEPFGSLDRALRDRLVTELPDLLRAAGIAAIHVTHDHAEAFGVGDRVAVMTAGKLLQVGQAEDIWRRPESAQLARFMGHKNIVERDGRSFLVPSTAASIDVAGGVDVEVLATRFRDGRFFTSVETDDGVLEFDLGERLTVGSSTSLVIAEDAVLPLD